MKLSIRERSDAYVVDISGSLDSSVAADFENKLKDIVSKHKNMVLNFKNVNYVSSAGLRAFVSMQKELNKYHKSLCIENANDIVKEVLNITGFASFLEVK